MSDFSPILMLLLCVYFAVILPIQAAKRAKDRTGKSKPGARHPAGAASQPAAPKAEDPPRRVLQDAGEGDDPCHEEQLGKELRVSGWHDEPYRGSLGGGSEEGWDPCHEEQLESMPPREDEPEPDAQQTPALSFSWTGSEIVRGLVVSEVLRRRR